MIAALGAAMLLVCGTAQAADGELYLDGCLGRLAVTGCPATSLGLPVGIAASPDGNQVYVATEANGVGSITGLRIFDRHPQTGTLSARPGPTGCFVPTSNMLANCTQVGGTNNPGVAYDVAASPDGRSVVMATWNGAVLNFSRDTSTGALSYINCVGFANACTPLTANFRAQSVAFSPDSSNVYVKTSSGLAVLDRNAISLAVTQKPGLAGCFSEGDVSISCDEVDGLGTNGYKVTVSPDGAQVYTAFNEGDNGGGIGVFNRAGDGTLTQIAGPAGGCISYGGGSGGAGNRCVVADSGVATSYASAISPDGTSVYLGGEYGITSYRRNANGTLTKTGCLGLEQLGCAPVPAGLRGVLDLAITPDGGELIAAAFRSRTVVSFRRDQATGALSLRPGVRGCISNNGDPARCLQLGLLSSDHLSRVAMDPSGVRFHVTNGYGVLATVARDFAPTCQSRTVDTAFNTLVSVPLSCSDANNDPITLEKVGLPAAGQLGEIINGAVFYSPFANFIGPDTFTYRAKSPSRGVDGPPAAVTVNVAGPVAPSVNPSGLDGDRDGFSAGQDCNDANAAIRPGAVEVKGNRTDENCDGTAEPFPTLSSGVVSKWDVKGGRLTLTALQVTQQFPSGWKARVICRGKPKCTFSSKTLKAGKVRRGAATIIASLSRRQRVFRAGQTVEIWVTAPNFNTKVARLVLKRNRIPLTEPFCVLPGSTRVQKTCT